MWFLCVLGASFTYWDNNCTFIIHHVQVACITRLVPQKGVHLIRHAIYRTLELGGQFILLGSSPVPQIQESLGFSI